MLVVEQNIDLVTSGNSGKVADGARAVSIVGTKHVGL